MWLMLRLKYYYIMFFNLDGDKSQYWETSVDGHPRGMFVVHDLGVYLRCSEWPALIQPQPHGRSP